MSFKAYVVVTGLGGLNLACSGVLVGGDCESLKAGDSCWIEGSACEFENATNCGLNGYHCDDGEWRRSIRYCNPPSLPTEKPPAEPPPAEPPPEP